MFPILLALSLLQQQRPPDLARPEPISGERPRPIADAAILAFVRTPFDPMSDPGKWRHVLGTQHGVPVVVSYVCSDLCPQYTRRIVRYNVAAGLACDRIGGISRDLIVPKGIGAGPRRYCIPAITEPWQK